MIVLHFLYFKNALFMIPWLCDNYLEHWVFSFSYLSVTKGNKDYAIPSATEYSASPASKRVYTNYCYVMAAYFYFLPPFFFPFGSFFLKNISKMTLSLNSLTSLDSHSSE